MVYGCGNNMVKFLVFIVNFFICLAGGAVMAVGIWANLDEGFSTQLQKLITEYNLDVNLGDMRNIIWGLVGIGGLVFLTGFLGCCGAACESRCLLGLFFTIVLILFIAELAVGISVIVLKDKFRTGLTTVLSDAVQEAKKTGNEKPLHELETKIHCCGITGKAGDPSNQRYGNVTTMNCPTVEGVSYTTKDNCIDVIWTWAKDNAVIAGGVAIGVLVVELLAMIFACCMCNAIAQKEDYRGYA